MKSLIAGSLVGGLALPFVAWAADQTPLPRKILLCSGWQVIGIGELSQTLGSLRLLEQYLPDAQVSLWLAHGNDAIVANLLARFPKVRIIQSTIDPKTLVVAGDALKDALQSADLVIHGPGPISMPELLDWCQANKKKFGLLGVTLGNIDEKTSVRLSNAAFVFTRESLSLDALTRARIKGPAVGIVPDPALAMDVRDEKRAGTFLQSSGLEAGKYICVIPRLRYTPFRHYPPQQIKQRAEASEKFAETDHAKLRAAMTAAVEKTRCKVLVCPEMTYELEIMDRLLIDPLPPEIRKSVVKRTTFWQPDEAASVYAKAAAVISFEFHSAVLALAAGVPGVYVRQPTETRKGQMFRDIGLSEWIGEIDETSAEKLTATTLAILTDLAAAKANIAKAMELVAGKFKVAMGKL